MSRKYFVIRKGWNSANQSSYGRPRNPKNNFESGLLELVAIVDSETEEEAIRKSGVASYNNQSIFATSNPRSLRGLTATIREFIS